MRAERADNINFKGKLIIVNRLSSKPNRCINKVKGNIENLINKKDYNLYITQDYSKNEININTDYTFSQKHSQYPILSEKAEEKIPVNAKASTYIDVAKRVINNYEAELKKQKVKQWEKEYNKQELEEIGDILKSFALIPILVTIGLFAECAQDIGKNFKQIVNKAKKFATKKG